MTGGAPAARTISGVEVVTIPLAEYADLLDCRRRLAELTVARAAFERPPASPIERDPELATFLAERLGRATGEAILVECRSRFGPARTPSRSALDRYWRRLRARVEEVPDVGEYPRECAQGAAGPAGPEAPE